MRQATTGQAEPCGETDAPEKAGAAEAQLRLEDEADAGRELEGVVGGGEACGGSAEREERLRGARSTDHPNNLARPGGALL